MVIVRDGVRVDQYCWYRDSTSMEYMQEYRDATWSRKIYKNQLHEPVDQELVSDSVSCALRLGNGAWLLGGAEFRGLVLTSYVQSYRWESSYVNPAYCDQERPDFILLSGEPILKSFHQQSWAKNVDIVIDGSNRKWYIERIVMEGDFIHITERSGAFVKSW